MKNSGNIYKASALMLALFALGCSKGEVRIVDEAKEPTADRFVTLMPQDTVNVPAAYPVDAIVGTPEKRPTDTASGADPENRQPLIGHRFRIQLVTSNQFSEASFARKVAEEIFDKEIEIAYEAPYYKLRVGSFMTREEAESFLPQVRTAGYPDAIIVSTVAELRRAEPSYDTTLIAPQTKTGSGK